MHLIRCLFFIRVTYDISLYGVHVPGAQNWWADALSWGNVNFLYTQGKTVTYQQTTVPEILITLLIAEQPDWTSRHWIQLYRDYLHQIRLHRHRKSTALGAGGITIFVDLYKISNPFPVFEHTLMRFFLYVYRESVKAGTIKSYLAAVHHAQISNGLGDPKICDMP